MKNFFTKLFTKKPKVELIQLTQYEIDWIKVCKGHVAKDKNGIEKFMETFKSHYGWGPDKINDEYYDDFLDGLFNSLLSVWFKIHEGDMQHGLKQVFVAAHFGRFSQKELKPIERSIMELRSLIWNTQVIVDGNSRFKLD